MSTISRFKSTSKMATECTLGSLGIALPIVLLPAAIYGYADMEIMGAMTQKAKQAAMVTGEMNMEQSLMIKAVLQLTGIDLLLELVFGPIIAASAIYTATSKREGRSPTLHGAINFAMTRYGRLFKWHAVAQISIKMGMLILIPGVLFMMMYAMVDPVLCFEKEKWPLDRSKRLTRVWRKTIFMFMLPWIIIVATIPLLLFWSANQGGMTTFALSLFYFLSLFWLHSGFGTLYAERLEAGRKAAARKAAEQSGEAVDADPLPTLVAAVDAQPASQGTPKGVQPMGMGQKFGLSLVAIFVGLFIYAVAFEEDPVSMDPTHISGGQPTTTDGTSGSAGIDDGSAETDGTNGLESEAAGVEEGSEGTNVVGPGGAAESTGTEKVPASQEGEAIDSASKSETTSTPDGSEDGSDVNEQVDPESVPASSPRADLPEPSAAPAAPVVQP